MLQTFVFQRTRFHNRTSKLFGKLLWIDDIAVFLHKIRHIQGDDNRQAQVDYLRGQIQVAFKVRCIHQIDNDIGTFLDQVIPTHYFLGRVRREGVHAGQVGDDDAFVALAIPFLLLHRHTRPIADILSRPRQNVEHGGLAAIGIARKRYSYLHALSLSLSCP